MKAVEAQMNDNPMTYDMKVKAMLGTTNPTTADCIERNEEAWVLPVFNFVVM